MLQFSVELKQTVRLQTSAAIVVGLVGAAHKLQLPYYENQMVCNLLCLLLWHLFRVV